MKRELLQGDARWGLLNHPYLTYGVVTTTIDFAAGVDSGAACILVDASAGPITVTLPPTTNPPPGRGFLITKIDASANPVTVVASVGDVIDGNLSVTLLAQYDSITVISNGAGFWFETAGSQAGSTGLTVERITAVSGTVVATPTIDWTIVQSPPSFPTVTITLADGPFDGYLKTISCLNSDLTYVVTPLNGVAVDLGSSGTVTYRWGAVEAEWLIISVFEGVID